MVGVAGIGDDGRRGVEQLPALLIVQTVDLALEVGSDHHRTGKSESVARAADRKLGKVLRLLHLQAVENQWPHRLHRVEGEVPTEHDTFVAGDESRLSMPGPKC